MIEYDQRRKGRQKENKYRYQEQLMAAMVPYMDKKHRMQVVNDAFKEAGTKPMSLKEKYEKTRQRFIDAGALQIEDGSK